jgi:hypothetical protein
MLEVKIQEPDDDDEVMERGEEIARPGIFNLSASQSSELLLERYGDLKVCLPNSLGPRLFWL